MKNLLLALLFGVIVLGSLNAQVRVASKYSFPLRPSPATARDSMLNELKSIRCAAFALDVDGDNRSEIAVTTYGAGGGVSVFEAIGNDSIRLVWTSPRLLTGGGASTPRYVLFGDLDNDGKKEVIYQSNNNGVCIFEWDGVVGSDNYGTAPSQIIGTPFITNVTGNPEYMEVGDVDGDGQEELLIAYNANTNAGDNYYIISGVGDWTTGDPGFSSFNVDYVIRRTDPGTTAYGLGGSPWAMIAANFDGTGLKEILIHTFNLKNVFPLRTTGANTFALPDTTTGKGHLFLGGPSYDDYAIFGGMAHDIDGDGREEVYLPTLTPDTNSTNRGIVHMISYNTGESTSIIDTVNATKLSVGVAITTFGYGYGDINNNGKKEIYITTTWPNDVISIEFQGGNKRVPANWIARRLYSGEAAQNDTSIAYRDSVGRRDTVNVSAPAFPSKIYGRNTDLDRDGREDIILPYQAIADSQTILTLNWNVGAAKYDTVSRQRVVNQKRWSLRVIERDPSQGVETKDLTIISPDDYKLNQNYPNPFNPSTTISFYLPIRDKISLKVYDVLGREVRTLINNEQRESGTGRIVWDGRNNAGKAAASGTYFYTLKFGNFDKTNKMMLLK